MEKRPILGNAYNVGTIIIMLVQTWIVDSHQEIGTIAAVDDECTGCMVVPVALYTGFDTQHTLRCYQKLWLERIELVLGKKFDVTTS